VLQKPVCENTEQPAKQIMLTTQALSTMAFSSHNFVFMGLLFFKLHDVTTSGA
jgi:hypothetical protein